MSEIVAGDFSLSQPCYLAATPAGAFYAVQGATKDNICRYLLFLLSQEKTPLFAEQHLNYLHDDKETAMQMLFRMQQLGYIQALSEPTTAIHGALEDVLPELLEKLSSSGKVILSDEQGFYLALSGFVHENAEELSALSAGLHEIYQRHKALLQNNLGVKTSALGLVDVAGTNDIGFWPLFFARTRFSLVIADVPRFNSKEFAQIINYLAIRYSD
jgi:hypothetical protein